MEQRGKTFVYKKKMNYREFYGPLAMIAATALIWYSRSGIGIKRLRLLSYPTSVYVLGGLSVVLLAWALWKFFKSRQSASNPHPITVGESSFSFPHKDGKVEVAFSEIESTERRSDDDDGASLAIKAKGEDYEFFEKYFEDKANYTAFIDSVEKY